MKKLFILLLGLWFTTGMQAQLRLTLDKVIEMAADSSLTAFRNQTMYLAGYWE